MATIPPTTNPSPEEALATFVRIGTRPLSTSVIPSTLIRDLVARGMYLGSHGVTPADQTEFDMIYQEVAIRLMGRDTALK